MGKWRQPKGLIPSYLACFLLLTVSIQQSYAVPFVEEQSIKKGPVELVRPEEDLIWNGWSHTFPTQFPSRTRREKRGLDYDDYEEPIKCLVIPSKSATATTRPTVPINLIDLLNTGSPPTAQEIQPQINDVILIMGIRGSGKAALIRLLAKDLGRLIAGLTRNGNMVIIDTEDGLKATPTTSSNVMPELVIKQGSDNGTTTTAFYDFPYFDESRGPEQDIAVNYFMKQTMNKLTRVKIIVTVSQSVFSFNSHKIGPVGKDNQDFDYLVTNATTFLRDIPSYNKSLGLVVTKVSDSDDKLVMDGIGQFLTTYLDDLRSQLELNSTMILKSALQRKIQFVEVFLEQDQQGKYARIHLSRSPTECGPLSHSREAINAKEGITRLYSETLEYASVKSLNFSDTLADASKLLVMDYLSTLNKEISIRLNAMMDEFKTWHDNLILETPDLVNKTKAILATTVTFGGILASLNNVENNSTPAMLMEGIVHNLGELGYNVSQHDQQNFKRNLSYLAFFEEISNMQATIFKEEWKLPIENVAAVLQEEESATKDALRAFVIPINKIIAKEITALLDNFTECYLHQSSAVTDLGLKLQLTQEGIEAISDAISQMDAFGEQHYPEDFADPFVSLLDKLGCNNSSDFQEGTREAQVYFKYDEEANPPGVPRAMKDWVAPVAELSRRFMHLKETAQLSFQIHKTERENAGLMRELECLRRELVTQNRTFELSADMTRRLRLEHEILQETLAQTKNDLNSTIENCENERKLKYNLLKFTNANKNSWLHLTAIQRDWQSLKYLVMLGDNLNLQNMDGETPLILSAIGGDADSLTIVKYIVDRGASAYLTNKMGQSFLHKLFANGTTLTTYGLRDIAEYIVTKNISSAFNIRDSNGITPLMLAAQNIIMDEPLFNLLLRNRVDINLADRRGQSLDFYIKQGGRNPKLLAVLNTERGYISSTNYPNNYPSNENRNWSITVPAGKKVRIMFEAFSTRRGYDRLRIMEGVSQQQIIIAEGGSLPLPLVSQSNQVKLNFRSNAGINYIGFRLRWESCVDCIPNYSG